MNDEAPSIAVNVLVFRGTKLLLGLRRSSPPMWSPPGGHLLMNEALEDCGRREVREETGLIIQKVRLGPFVSERNAIDNTHYLNFFLIADVRSGVLCNGEPEDIFEWRWFESHCLPKPLFFNVRTLLGRFSITRLRRFKTLVGVDTRITN